MIRNILIAFIVCVVVATLLVWAIRGGPSAIIRGAQSIGNPLDVFFQTGSSSPVLPQLPWQPTTTYGGAQFSPSGDSSGESGGVSGNPKPLVHIVHDNAGTQQETPNTETLELQADDSLTSPVVLSGWSIKSGASGARYPLGPQTISLKPGGSVVITSGGSQWNTVYDGTVWQVYLASPHEIWGNDHDTIQLLDGSGNIVDSFSY